MVDVDIKCCRCRHEHKESDRGEVPSKRIARAYQSICPKCGAHSYFDMTPQVAYCWSTGEIEFGDEKAEESIALATGPKCELKPFIASIARLAYDGHTLLVPGLPEADELRTRLAAVHEFIEQIRKREGRNKRFSGVRAFGKEL